jgi:hypothetical protein
MKLEYCLTTDLKKREDGITIFLTKLEDSIMMELKKIYPNDGKQMGLSQNTSNGSSHPHPPVLAIVLSLNSTTKSILFHCGAKKSSLNIQTTDSHPFPDGRNYYSSSITEQLRIQFRTKHFMVTINSHVSYSGSPMLEYWPKDQLNRGFRDFH